MHTIGVPSHKRSERMVSVLALLEDRGEMALSELAEMLKVSEATIRRDVALLDTQGLLERTHGGARPTRGSHELPVQLRDGRNHEAKARIGKAAVEMIPAGRHAIALTGGTTTAELLRCLHDRDDLTIITNSLSIGHRAAEMGQSRVLLAGGVLRSNSLELVGHLAEATLRLVNIGTAFVGVDGISAESGLTTHDEIEARTNHAMIERAQRVIVVVDSSKFGRITLAKMADINEVDVIVTDSRAPKEQLKTLEAAGPKVVVVDLSERS